MLRGFPLSEIAKFPSPGTATPTRISFSHDNSLVTYLYGDKDNPTQQLYALDVASGEKRIIAMPPGGGTQEDKLSPEEELRRQRERMLAVGITHYQRAPKSDRLLIPISGNLYVQDAPDADLRLVVNTDGQPTVLNPQLAPDGEWIAYVQDAEIYVVSASGNEAQQITHGARGTGKTHGLAEYIAQEEFGRGVGFWWSKDGNFIYYTEVDETHIPEYRIVHQGKDDLAHEDHRYAFAGATNADVKLGIIPRTGGETVWLDTDFGDETYIVRVFSWQDNTPGALVLNRAQDTLYLAKFDIETGAQQIILTEQNDTWVNIRSVMHKLLRDGTFIWGSERSGYQHLYHYAPDGTLKQQLTGGDWLVDSLIAIDETKRIAYYTSSAENPLESHLYAVSLDGGTPRRITQTRGMHSVVIDRQYKHFVDVHHNLETPPHVTLRDLESGDILHTLHENSDERPQQFNLTPPEIVTLTNREGTTLYGMLYKPTQGEAPYPTIVYVYGGPGPQLVSENWRMTANLRIQYLRNQGYLVCVVDNRGSARRGLAFEGAIKHRMGTVEVDDQVDGVRWLVDQGLADAERVGVYGWSYGGYMTLMCLAKAPDVFKVGVAGAPVTHWDTYDTGYTERYMGTPQANPEGYEAGNVMQYVDQISGKLLLIHGMLDENVLFRHTARLINALNRAEKDYDLLIFPDERHMPRNPQDRTYMERRLVTFFQRNL